VQQQRAQEKWAALQHAQWEVSVHENLVDRLVTLHRDCGPTINWTNLETAPEPVAPELQRTSEREAQEALARYKPGLLDKLLRREAKTRATLIAVVDRARAEDRNRHERAVQEHRQAVTDWQEARELAARVLGTEPSALLDVLRELSPFSELNELGSRIEFTAEEGHPIHVALHVHGESVIPRTSKSLLKSGRLSEKRMPRSQYHELFQDHVCSAVLRVAREVMANLPVDLVLVTAKDRLLNKQTGHLEEQALLSAVIPRSTINELNLDLIDPSDSMQNFVHRMDFKKSRGFQPIEALEAGEAPRPSDPPPLPQS